MITTEFIQKNLDEYLEFNSSYLFFCTDYLVVFGGALRDIISGQPYKINDVDILCLPQSKKAAMIILERQGYRQIPFFNPHIYKMYKDIKFIFQPLNYINKNSHIVQLITPYIPFCKDEKLRQDRMIKAFFNLLVNVDLSSSGVFFNGKNLYESKPNSIIHCQNKKYKIYPNGIMYDSKRVIQRIKNLGSEWTEILDEETYDNSNNNLNIKDFKVELEKF